MLPFIWYFPNLVVPLHAEKGNRFQNSTLFALLFETNDN